MSTSIRAYLHHILNETQYLEHILQQEIGNEGGACSP
jgi:hypothetical protein